jgi:hypothetical protein
MASAAPLVVRKTLQMHDTPTAVKWTSNSYIPSSKIGSPRRKVLSCSFKMKLYMKGLGLARAACMLCIRSIFGRETTKYLTIYRAYERFWPNLEIPA